MNTFVRRRFSIAERGTLMMRSLRAQQTTPCPATQNSRGAIAREVSPGRLRQPSPRFFERNGCCRLPPAQTRGCIAREGREQSVLKCPGRALRNLENRQCRPCSCRVVSKHRGSRPDQARPADQSNKSTFV